MENEILETETTENSETVENTTTEIIYNVECIDYTEQLETLTTQIEYLTTVQEQQLVTNYFNTSLMLGCAVCFILYRFIKIFF